MTSLHRFKCLTLSHVDFCGGLGIYSPAAEATLPSLVDTNAAMGVGSLDIGILKESEEPGVAELQFESDYIAYRE